jgi:hypothetical protein
MAFGKRKTGGDLKPLLKWDGRIGRFYTQDQVDGQPEQKDVTDSFCAVIDLESAEKGWLRFPKGAAPEMDLFPLDVDDIGDPPEGDGWKEGLRFQSRLEGQDVWRETLTAAVGLWPWLGRAAHAIRGAIQGSPRHVADAGDRGRPHSLS